MAANFDAASLAERTTARGATECAPSSRSTAHILETGLFYFYLGISVPFVLTIGD